MISPKSDTTMKNSILYEKLKEFSQISTTIFLGHLFLEWTALLGVLICAIQFSIPALYVFAFLWVGSRQHALLIMMHDATHYRICKNHQLNDWISDLFLAWPLFLSTAKYRENHLIHHQFTNSHKDPDWTRKQNEDWKFPKTKTSVFLILLKDLIGWNTLDQLKTIKNLSKPKKSNHKKVFFKRYLIRIFYYSAIFGLLTCLGLWNWYFFLWLLPAFTWLKMLLRLRSIGEHFGVENENEYNNSRTTYPGFMEKIFLAPKNVNFHLDHHLYPAVPFYRLPSLHNLLLKQKAFRQNAHLTPSYLGVLKEVSIKRSKVPRPHYRQCSKVDT